MKKWIIFVLSLLTLSEAFAFEDNIIITTGKLTGIKIQHNDVIDVFPLITISNDKNTLIVHPLKEGKTKFSVLKNNKDKIVFDVEVSESSTNIKAVEGFEVLKVDNPPDLYEYYFNLDAPPILDEYGSDIEEPPALRGEN